MARRLCSILLLTMLCVTPSWAIDRDGSRSHEPNLRELTADLDGLHQLMLARLEAMKSLMDERDRMYSERDTSRRTAVEAALIAAKEQTATSFAASKEAISKADTAQHEYNIRSNEFRGQLDDQAKRLISRAEVESVIRNLEEKIARLDGDQRQLRDTVGSGVSKGEGMNQLWQYILAGLGLLGTFGFGIYISRKVPAVVPPVVTPPAA
jgi:hypothetical protein